MRKYINQIDDRIIATILSENELIEYKDIAKKYSELKSAKHKAEKEIMTKINGAVIGELEEIEINYLAFGNTFYISYKDKSKEISLFNKIKSIFK